MSKKTLYKAVSLLVVFSVLALSFPTAANAIQNNKKFTFSKFIQQPVDFFISLFPFLQTNNPHQKTNLYDQSEQNTDNNNAQKTGDIDIVRPSKDG